MKKKIKIIAKKDFKDRGLEKLFKLVSENNTHTYKWKFGFSAKTIAKKDLTAIAQSHEYDLILIREHKGNYLQYQVTFDLYKKREN